MMSDETRNNGASLRRLLRDAGVFKQGSETQETIGSLSEVFFAPLRPAGRQEF